MLKKNYDKILESIVFKLQSYTNWYLFKVSNKYLTEKKSDNKQNEKLFTTVSFQ